jgi:hypothetical protein
MKILNTYPIICPQIVFKDRFGNHNAFTEINPAIWFDESTQTWTVLVRGINYKKLSNSSFTLYHSPAHSLYWIAEGKDLNSLEFRELKFEYGNLKWYSSYWNGVEDIRFLDKDIIIACVPQLNPGGGPALFKAKINRQTQHDFAILHSFQSLEPHERPEKNWLPFPGGHVVLYSCSPLILKPLETDVKQEVPCSPEVKEALQGYHGSTNGVLIRVKNSNNHPEDFISSETKPLVKVGDSWVFLVHKNNENKRTVHRWLWISDDYLNIRVSDPFTFFKHSYIEFPCGLVYKDNSFYVSLGVNDDKGYILQVEI